MTTSTSALTSPMMAYLGPRLQATRTLITASNPSSFEAALPLGRCALAVQHVDLPDFAAPRTTDELSTLTKSITARACSRFSQSVKALGNLPQAYLPAALRFERLDTDSIHLYVDANLVRFDHASLLIESARMASALKSQRNSTPLTEDVRVLKEYLDDPLQRWNELKHRLVVIYKNYNGYAVREKSLEEASESLIAWAGDHPELIIAHRAEVITALRAGIWERLSLELLGGTRYDRLDIDMLRELGLIPDAAYAKLTEGSKSPYYFDR